MAAGDEIVRDKIQALVAGVPAPSLPNWDSNWTLDSYRKELELFHRKLLDYIRRLFSLLNETTLAGVEVDPLTHWRYDSTTHKWQVKTTPVFVLKKGDESDWTDVADGSQPVKLPRVVTGVAYDLTDHVLFQARDQDVYVFSTGAGILSTVDQAEECVVCA